MQDATDDPEAIHAGEKELAEFKKAMNEARAFDASMPPSQSRMRGCRSDPCGLRTNDGVSHLSAAL